MSFELVENFEALISDHSIQGQTAPNGKVWATTGSAGVENMFRVVTLDGKKVLWGNPSYQQRAYLPLAKPLNSGLTGTLFFRIRYTTTDLSFYYVGLSDEQVPGQWATSLKMSYITETGLHVSGNQDSDKYVLAPNTWYKVWMVVDLGDTTRTQMNYSFRVYFQNETTGAIKQMVDSVQSGETHTDFRLWQYTQGSPLQTFAIHTGYSAPFYIDDIYIDTSGENLSDPTGQPMLTLVDAQVSDYTIIFPSKPSSGTSSAYEAALILKEYIEKATNVPMAKSGSKRIYVVGDAASANQLGVDISGFSEETYVVCVKGDNVILAGKDGVGDPWQLSSTYNRVTTPSLHAVSRFLEECIGARWYWPVWSPGDEPQGHTPRFGEDYNDLKQLRLQVPKTLYIQDNPTSALRDLDICYWPKGFADMGFTYDGTPSSFAGKLAKRYQRWIRLNRLGGFDRIWVRHYWWSLMPKSRYGSVGGTTLNSSGAKFFAFYNGVRGGNEPIPTPTNDVPKNQLCVSGENEVNSDSPQILDEIMQANGGIITQVGKTDSPSWRSISIAPNDEDGHCQCQPCLNRDKGDMVPLSNGTHRNIGDRYFWFFNKVAERVQQAYKTRKVWVTTLAYSDYILPHGLKDGTMCDLVDNLIVYDVHNTYLFRYGDAYMPPPNSSQKPEEVNAKLEDSSRIEMWGRKAGHLAVWLEPYWHGGDYRPFFNATPLVGAEQYTDLLARLNFNRYMGGYFNSMGLAHWHDLFLLAQLFGDSRPLFNAPRSSTIDGYINQLKAKADRLREDYYTGLYGVAGSTVKAFHDRIGKQIKDLIHNVTDNSNEKAGVKFYDYWPTWTIRTLFDSVFSPIKGEADKLLASAASLLKPGSREYLHLQMVQQNWNFTTKTIDLFTNLEDYAKQNIIVYNMAYLAPQLKACRDLGRTMVDRLDLVNAVNNEEANPDLCTLVLPPTTITEEDGLEYHPYDKTKQPVLLGFTRKVIRTILTMMNDKGCNGWPVGIDILAVRRPRPKINLSLSSSALWIDWYSRASDNSNIYLVILNETNKTMKGVTLTIKNLDPNKETRKLSRYKGDVIVLNKGTRKGAATLYWPETDNTGKDVQSEVVTDTATLDVAPGVTVLVLENANFAPFTDVLVTYGDNKGTYTKNQLNTAVLQMYQIVEDHLIAGSKGGGRFYIIKQDGLFTTSVQGKLKADPPNTYYESINSDYLSTIFTNAGLKYEDWGGTYDIYGAVYDSDGVKRLAVKSDGTTRASCTIKVE